VIGSRGSVVPFFRDLLAKKADSLPITDERMTRFWITLNQGIEFVLSCLGLTRGGEIFVPKIPSMRMVDLAKAMAPGLPHKIVGIRPGEKLHEVMITEDDSRATVELDDRFVICPTLPNWTVKHLSDLGARPVAEGFRYGSDCNLEWLDASGLQKIMARKA
jgi:UDP-N-acetylglucosamine 4,6-dehydratase/5-epimerase